MQETPKVLVISHTVFSSTGNMGKTMMDILSCLPPENLAQIYFHSEVPTQVNCERYFRITDKNILKSLLTRKSFFRIFEKANIDTSRIDARTDKGMTAKVYQFSRRRTPAIYFLRNAIWSLGKWDSTELNNWIGEFAPDVIFFAAGDYAFAYKIVCRLADRYHLPVVIWCADDHYIGRKPTASLLYRYVCRNRMTWAKRTASRSCYMIAISDKMCRDYAELFRIPVSIMRISSMQNQCMLPVSQRAGIVYTGNLGINRVQPLVELGNALKKAGIPGYEYIDVYSADKNQKILNLLTMDHGICFHGSVGKAQLEEILGSARFVVYVEAFDNASKTRTRYSLSTKVGEYLQSGACILAYGPRDISSIAYLEENDASVVLNCADEISEQISRLLEDTDAYTGLQQRAFALAEKCHSKQGNDEKILSILMEAKRNGGK